MDPSAFQTTFPPNPPKISARMVILVMNFRWILVQGPIVTTMRRRTSARFFSSTPTNSEAPALVGVQDLPHPGQDWQLAQDLERAVGGPVPQQTHLVAIVEPGGNLLQDGLFQVGGQRFLPWC